MKLKKAVEPLYIFAPIQRVDDDKREIEAYAFVNEVVDGEGGIRLKRSAMEAATPDYMQWANVRRMHQPDAVAIALDVNWDDTGALMTVRVEDDDAWHKVKTGVYKGLSVGVKPTVMRGKDVNACKWFETSLVDRPKDPDTKFIAIRGEDGSEAEECEIEDEDESIVRGAFATYIKNYEGSRLRSFAIDAFSSVIWDIQNGSDTNKDRLVREACAELANYLAPIVARGEFEDPSSETLVRLEDGQEVVLRADIQAKDETISRLEGELKTSTEELGSAREELTRAEGRIKELEDTPAQKPPVRGVFAVDKEFLKRIQDNETKEKEEIQTELQRLETAPLDPNDPEGIQRSQQIGRLKLQLTRTS